MIIIGKEFRQMKSTPTIQENDVQGTMYSELMWGFIYIYNNTIVVRWSSVDRKENNSDNFGMIKNDFSEIRKKILLNLLKKAKTLSQ